MTYHTLKCPHCKRILNRTTGSPDIIGNPFSKCPWCGGVYVASFTKEWVTRTPFQRKKFLIEKPLCGAFITFIVVTGLIVSIEQTVTTCVAGLISGILSAVLVLICWIPSRKSSMQEYIEQSLERTKSAKYVELLKQAGFKIYPIDGVDIGSIHDEEDSPLQEDIKAEIDKSIFWG